MTISPSMISKITFPVLVFLMFSCYMPQVATGDTDYTSGMLIAHTDINNSNNQCGTCQHWLIRVDPPSGCNPVIFNPVNLSDFAIAPCHGKRVLFTYEYPRSFMYQNNFSANFTGTRIILTSIK
jgi:hypothetical protein